MGLFHKKKEEKSCCCGSGCTPEKMAQAEAAKTTAGIKVLGAGCAKCHALEDATKAALAELNMDTTISKCGVPDVSVRRDDAPASGVRAGGILPDLSAAVRHSLQQATLPV